MNDSDRYVWLLSHMGLVEARAGEWNPARDGPLLSWLDSFVGEQTLLAGEEFLNSQRGLLERKRYATN